MSKKGICEQHSKDLEMFCFDCEGVKKPMCSLCMCEHYKTVHQKNHIVHVKDLIGDGLKKVEINIKNTSNLQEKLKGYGNKAQKNQIAKDNLKAKLDEKLLKLKNLFKEQESLASANHADILRCHENTYKEISKCESKIKENLNDPQKIARKVDDMVRKQRYWEGYEEVNRALEDTTKLDDAEINKNLDEYDALLKDHQNLLDALDNTPEHASEYSLLKKENEQLKRKLFFLLSRKIEGIEGISREGGEGIQGTIRKLVNLINKFYYRCE